MIGAFKTYTKHWRANDYLIAALLIMIPVFNRLMPILLVLLTISTVVYSVSFSEAKERLKPSKPLFWFMLFYLFHLIGLTYTDNMSFGWNDLGIKLSFLLVPLILAFNAFRLSKRQLIDVFIAGLVLSAAIALSKATFKSIYYPEDNHWAYFTESYLAFSMHRSYYATYMAFGVLLAVERFFEKHLLKYALAAILFGVITVLTFSKAGILIMVFLLIPLLFILVYRNWGKWLAATGTIVVILAVSGALWVSPTLTTRFSKMIDGITIFSTTNNTSVESNESRLIMWSTSLKLINENMLLGVGTGDVSDALDEKNLELGNTGVAERSLNAHNQYLNSWVQLGIGGFILLAMILITGMGVALRTRNLALVFFILVVSMTMCFESFLETQAGIIPVTLLITLFVIKAQNNEIAHSDAVLSS